MVSQAGINAKYLNSNGYLIGGVTLFITLCVIRTVSNNNKKQRGELEGSIKPKWEDTVYYDRTKQETKTRAIWITIVCGALNFTGELCVIFAFMNALKADINQGILSSIYAAGAIVPIIASVVILKSGIRICEVSLPTPNLQGHRHPDNHCRNCYNHNGNSTSSVR